MPLKRNINAGLSRPVGRAVLIGCSLLVLLLGATGWRGAPFQTWFGEGSLASAQDDSDDLVAINRRLEEEAAGLTRSENADERFRELRFKVEKVGVVPVIIRLRAPFRQESELRNEVEVNGQREFINRVQNQVVTSLFGYDPASIKQYECVPYLAVRVNSIGLEWLNYSPQVLDISEDQLSEPVLSESVRRIGGEAAWNLGNTGAGQTIAIIDNGVDGNHPFLEGKVLAEACYSTNFPLVGARSICPGGVGATTATDSALPCRIENAGCDHGTQVAGIAAGRGPQFSGVAKDATLIAIQAFTHFTSESVCGRGVNGCLRAFQSDLIAALEQVYLLRKFYSIAAVNLSSGTERYSGACDSSAPAMKAIIDLLHGEGTATIIASGNQGYTNAINYPACISSAISVGSTTSLPGSPERVSAFSNSSTLLKLLAPGDGIYSSTPGGGFSFNSGTSMAAPHVAGAFAIAKQKASYASVPDILNALTMTGVRITDPRNRLTRPRIQIDAALEYINREIPSNPVPQPPSQLVTVPNSTSLITLQWKDNSNNEIGFLIRRRSVTDEGWSTIGRVGRNVTMFQSNVPRPGLNYLYSVTAFNVSGESLMSNESLGRTPESGPAPPSNLTIAALTSTAAQLNWRDNSNQESGFRLYRRMGGADGWYPFMTVGANVTSVQVSLNAGMMYYFAVSTVNRDGESELSNEVNAMTGLVPPTAPTELRASPMSSTRITLNWRDNSTNEIGFRVRRRLGVSGSWSMLADVGAGVTSLDDTGLTPGTTCYYLVSSINAAGESALSNEAEATPLDGKGVETPDSPGGLMVRVSSNSAVELDWIDNSFNEMGFQVWECAGRDGPWRLVGMVSSDTTNFAREGLASGEIYSYFVRSYNGAGESVDSNVVNIVVPRMNFIPLENNRAVSDRLNRFEGQYYRIHVPAGAEQLSIETAGEITGDGNVDLYVRAENQPNRFLFNCRSMRRGSGERCTVNLPRAGNWHILVFGNYALSSRFTINATYTMKQAK